MAMKVIILKSVPSNPDNLHVSPDKQNDYELYSMKKIGYFIIFDILITTKIMT